MSALPLRRGVVLIASVTLAGIVFGLPSLIDWLRPSIDFTGAPEPLRQVYYRVVVSTFPVLALISATLILRVGHRAESAERNRSRISILVANATTPTVRSLRSEMMHGHRERGSVIALLVICLAQFLIPLLLFVHRITHGVVLSYGWGWQMYS
jgi:hypothetical protein